MANKKTIAQLFSEGTEIDESLRKSVRKAIKMHKKLGYPIVVEKEGKPVWVQPEDIDIGEEE